MNIVAVDIGNTNITVGLFLDDEQKSVETISGNERAEIDQCLAEAWNKVPTVERSTQAKRDGVIVVSSVKPAWTKMVESIAKSFGENIFVIGKDVPIPMEASVDEPGSVGTDRLLCAAAAYAVTEKAVVVADFGTAVTIDLVDNDGVFCGGVIFPGFEAAAQALKETTANLPEVEVKKPASALGKNTRDAINAGLYYSAVGILQEVIRQYAEVVGAWPVTVITGAGARIIKDDCCFIDKYAPNLVIKGIVIAYQAYVVEQFG